MFPPYGNQSTIMYYKLIYFDWSTMNYLTQSEQWLEICEQILLDWVNNI